MSITFDEREKVFHLTTKNTSYIMKVAKEKYLSHVYWGRKIKTPDMENAQLNRFISFDAVPDTKDRGYSLDFVCQEYPVGCGTDYRIPAVQAVFSDGSRAVELIYDSYKITSGKPKLKGLPATYIEDASEADTLEIVLTDTLKSMKVVLMYTAYNEIDAITRSVRIINESSEQILLEKVMSASVDYETSDYDFVELSGAWGRERHIERNRLRSGIQSIESRRGASSHQLNPFFALASKNANEEYGEVYGFNLVYSGNFTAGVEVDQIFKARAYIGMNDYDFSWLLESGESFQAPEAVMVYSSHGFGEMSRVYHRLYRKRLVRGKYRDAIRPILANNWEATYFDFNEEKILELAKTASELGIELLVLDDGWFGKRNSDNCSLGDWYVNKEKLPDGIGGLAEKVKEYGILFGLWFEPEMVSPDSDLYRAHPDWCIHIPGRERTECRNQLTLDLSREDVCEYIIKTVSQVLDEAAIGYVKWDMNRHMSELGSAGLPPKRQKEMPHRYMLGLYHVMEEIVSKHPDVLFESCSGGGGRFDPGMLYYMPQTWTSDDTDAVERLYIQYGTSLVYPVSAMGCHVSAVPNHQAHRMTSLSMRGDVAMSGNFGYELDLAAFTEEEKDEVRMQIKQYKDLRTFIQSGDMYRLQSPFEGNTTAWQFISEDGKDIFAAYFRILCEVNGGISRMKFTALEADAVYELLGVNGGKRYSGDELMNIGLTVDLWGDFNSRTWRFRKV
ncbi:MAG: alpha-galactosidase [Lachnospiraceae bacterium]|nr:alpha-galactosidase [Lachnospiraceae bacterium]MCI8824664.1 alpha-galactosidase [Lachnospiraceae bacterium]